MISERGAQSSSIPQSRFSSVSGHRNSNTNIAALVILSSKTIFLKSRRVQSLPNSASERLEMHFLHILLAAVLMVVIHAAAIEPVNLVAEESVQQPQRERMSEAVRQIRRGVFSTEAAHIGEKIDVTKLVQDVLREAGILNPDLLAGIPEYRGYGGPGEIGGPEGTGGPVEPGKTPISGRYRGVRVPVGYGGYRYRRSGVLDRSGGDGGYGILLGIGGRGGNGGSGGHGGHAGHGLFGGIGGNGGRGGSGGNGGNGGDGLFGATGGNGGDGGSREDGTDGGTGAYFWDGRNGVNGAG